MALETQRDDTELITIIWSYINIDNPLEDQRCVIGNAYHTESIACTKEGRI